MQILQLTPFVLCSSLTAQIEFYCERIGFTCTFTQDNYAHLRQGPVAIRLLEKAYAFCSDGVEFRQYVAVNQP